MIGEIFNEVLYRPLLNALVFLYKITGDLGISIILLTLLIKLLLHPLLKKQIESQHHIKKLQPKVEEIKEAHKHNKEEQSKKLLELYKNEGVNPAAGCLPVLIQLPILIALYQVFSPGKALIIDGDHLRLAEGMLYGFLNGIGNVSKMFLGVVDLTQRNIVLAFLSGALQFVQSKLIMTESSKAKDPKGKDKVKNNQQKPQKQSAQIQNTLNSQMLYMMPALTFFFALSLPAALPLYWSTNTIVAIFQQWHIEKRVKFKKTDSK